jgi:hypothetical protein
VVVATMVMAAGAAAEERVPEGLGLMVMLKVLSYDAAFANHGKGDFVVVVPFAAGQEAKASALATAGEKLEVKSIKERPLKFVVAPLSELDDRKPTAVLLYDGFAGDALKTALERARSSNWYVLSLDEKAVQRGAVLGVGLTNGKPQPLINIAAARALGADFGPVLRLARTFQ